MTRNKKTETDTTLETPDMSRDDRPRPESEEREPVQSAEEGEYLEDELETAKAKARENYDRLLRVTAEFENYKKRSRREMDDFRRFANESLIKDILPIVDNLERALSVEQTGTESAAESLKEGVRMTLEGLTDTLKRFGVTPVESEGKPFDPNVHQAVSQEETEQYPDDTVSKELQKGYMLHSRLLRPAMVIVSKKPENAQAERSRSS